MDSILNCKEHSKRGKSISSLEIKELSGKQICHYCYSRDKSRDYIFCSAYPQCKQVFCGYCLKNFFESEQENLSEDWECFVCRKICHCEGCREKAEGDKDVVIVNDWRTGACLENEEKYCGPKNYKAKLCKPKLNRIPGKRAKRKSKGHNTSKGSSSSSYKVTSKVHKKPKLDISQQNDMQSNMALPKFGYDHHLNQYPVGSNGLETYPRFVYYSPMYFNPAPVNVMSALNPMDQFLVYSNQQPLIPISGINGGLLFGRQIVEEQVMNEQMMIKGLENEMQKGRKDFAEVVKREDMQN